MKSLKRHIKIPKYIIDNVIDTIDALCNWIVLVYALVFAVFIITEKVIPDLKLGYDLIALAGLCGVIFIPSREQRKKD